MTRRTADEVSYNDLLTSLDNVRNVLSNIRFGDLDPTKITNLIPFVAVVGNQSSGKSSLLEAICGQKLPVSDQRCTRCPIEIRMRRGPSSVKVWGENSDGGLIEGYAESIEEFHTKLLAIPELQAQQFWEGSIIMEIHSPDVEPITYVDLPGLFAQEIHREHSKQVRSIISRYLDKPNCVIVHVASITEDPVHDLANGLIDKYDHLRARTVTTYTKADRLDNWTNLNNRIPVMSCLTFSRVHEGETSRISTLQQEREFFERKNYRGMIGRQVLQNYLATKISTVIKANTKPLLSEMEGFRKMITTELGKVGRNVIPPLQAYSSWAADIAGVIQKVVDGRYGNVLTVQEQIKQNISEALPTEWPDSVSLTKEEVNREMSRIKGRRMAITVGSGEIIQSVSKNAVDEITPSVKSLLQAHQNCLELLLKTVLIDQAFVPSIRLEAGKIIFQRLFTEIIRDHDKMVQEILSMLIDVYQNPSLLNDKDLEEEFFCSQMKIVYEARNLLAAQNPLEAYRLLDGYLNAGFDMIKATEIVSNIESYWHLKMKAIQQTVHSKLENSYNNVQDQIRQAVLNFDQPAVFRESPEDNAQREKLKTAEQTLTEATTILRDFLHN